MTRIAPDIPLAQTTPLVAAHGTGLNENSAVVAKKLAKEIGFRNFRGQVLAVYLEVEPLISDLPSLVSFPYVVVVRSSSVLCTSERFMCGGTLIDRLFCVMR